LWSKDEDGEDDEADEEDEVYQPSDNDSEEESSDEETDESNWSAENDSGRYTVTLLSVYECVCLRAVTKRLMSPTGRLRMTRVGTLSRCSVSV